MNPTPHEDVGSSSFQFCHRESDGWTRRCFTVKFGDSPDAWRARILMPGAAYTGLICAVLEAEDDGAIRSLGNSFEWSAYVYAGRSTFKISLMAGSRTEFYAMCREIGALESWGERRSLWYKIDCIARWFWYRRPVLRCRSPLDVMR